MQTNKRKKIILVNHNSGDDWKSFRLYYPKIVGTSFYRKLEKIADYCYSNVEAVVFVSNVSAETFLELEGGKYKDKIHVIHNGISDTATPPERDYSEIKFVTVGTVNERKNQLNLIKCIHKVADDRIHLTVVGDGSMLNDCKAYVEENNIGDQIHLLGKRTDVGDILLQNNVFIMASLGEGLPIAAIEAMRCGLPLVLTDVGGCRELIDGNGLITQSDNDSLEIAIREVSKDTGILREYAKKSRELFVKCFDSRSMITNYCDLAKELNRA
jgi:glycosyltransferase involved in cell wall biosynthesis